MELRDLKAAILAPVVFFAVLALHETGHFLAARCLDIPKDFWTPLGIGTWADLCGESTYSMTPARAVISVMGPTVEVGAVWLLWLLSRFRRFEWWFLRLVIGVGGASAFMVLATWVVNVMQHPDFDWSNDLPKAAQAFMPASVGGHLFTVAFAAVLIVPVWESVRRWRSGLGGAPGRFDTALFIICLGLPALLGRYPAELWFNTLGDARC